MVFEQQKAVTDTVAAQSEDIGGFIQDHIGNSDSWHLPGLHIHLPHFEPINIFGFSLNLSISNHVVMVWIAGIFVLLLFTLGYKKNRPVQKGWGIFIEMLVLFIRDEIAIKNMGEKDGRRFTPLLVTFFIFIWIANLMGLVPLFTTSTSNISVTAALAIVTFFATQIYGIKTSGPIGYYKNLVPHGVPILLWPLMFTIELMGLVAKHMALTVRLFANMTAGHIVLFALLGLIIIFKSLLVAPVSIGFAVFTYMLEILVATIQAYIFTVLSSLFIGMSLNPEH